MVIDPQTRNQILDTIKSFRDEGRTVIYTSHYLAEIEKICDEVAIIDRGRITLRGRLDELLNDVGGTAVVFELLPTAAPELARIAAGRPGLKLIDASTLLLEAADSHKVAALLSLLEAAGIGIRQLRYQTASLEALYLRQTAAPPRDSPSATPGSDRGKNV